MTFSDQEEKTLASSSIGNKSNATSSMLRSSASRLLNLSSHLAAPTRQYSMTSSNALTNPRWKQLIAENIAKGFKEGEKTSVLYYALATLSTSGSVPEPHVRYVVHRGFLNEQRSKETPSGIEMYDKDFESNVCLLTTTDIRAPKAQQMAESAKANGGKPNGEITWWQESSQTQFRISGIFHLLPTPSHPLFKSFPGDRLAPPRASTSSSKSFDWAQERSRVFEKLSPGLLASFARPTPGSEHPNASQLTAFGSGDGAGEGDDGKDQKNSPWPLELPAPGKEENDEQKRLLKESEANFALVVFEPLKVDLVDLGRDQRSIFEKQGDGPNAGWTERRVVP